MSRQSDPIYPEYAELRAEADRRASWCVDPADINFRIPDLVAARGYDWAYAVLGRPYGGPQSLYGSDIELLKLAGERDLDPSLPQHVVEARAAAEAHSIAGQEAAAARRRLLDEEWQAIVAALAARQNPVLVKVAHNYTSGRHCESGYVQGGDHIVFETRLLASAGRLRREPGQSACYQPSRARNVEVLVEVDDDRLPTCKSCIRTVARVVGLGAATMLGEPPAGARGYAANRRVRGW